MSHNTIANAQSENLIQLSGIISDYETNPLPYVHVYDKSTKHYTATDNNGLYKLVVRKQDTIAISCIGFKQKLFYIPDSAGLLSFAFDVNLIPDTFWMKGVTIYPWRTYEEFRQAVLNLRMKTEIENENLRNNMAIIKDQIQSTDVPDPEITYSYIQQQQFARAENNGMVPTYDIFNPFRWKEFIDAIQNGSLWNSRELKNVKDHDNKSTQVLKQK